MRLVLGVVIALMGLVGGAGIGLVLKKAPEPPAEHAAGAEATQTEGVGHGDDYDDDFDEHGEEKNADSEYFELSRKLIVPIVNDKGVRQFVAIELHLELAAGGAAKAELHEPKIRAALLRTVIAFAHTGAFGDDAHPNETFEELARELRRSARRVLGDDVRSVLIGDLIKQDA